MTKITFEDLPSTNTPLSASNLNTLQDNVETAISSPGDIVVDSIITKNIFGNYQVENGYLFETRMSIRSGASDRIAFVLCKPNTTYTISRSVITSSFRVSDYTDIPTMTDSYVDYTVPTVIENNGGTTITYTTSSTAKYLLIHYANVNNDNATTIANSLNSIQVEEGTTTTTYSKYQNLNGYDNYCLEEQRIGTWVDGKPLYRKVINVGSKPTDSTITINSVVSNLDVLVKMSGTAYNAGFNQYYNIPNSHNDMSKWYLNAILVNKTNLQIRGGDGWNTASGLTDIYVIIEYTKTTD